MFVPINTYFERIYHTLENVIAPEMSSDFARSQVFAIIGLLGELANKIEYKTDLISEEIQMNSHTLTKIHDIIKESGLDIPADLENSLADIKNSDKKNDLTLCDKVNEIFRQTADHINAHKKEIEPLLYKKADGLLRDYITQISLRDLRFINPGSFDKIRASQKDA